jgi:hypothetical protein
VFFGQKKRHNAGGGASPLSDPAADGLAGRGSRPWQAWRRAAQKANRTWNEWLAAEPAARDRLYCCYVSALAEEQQAAAELQRIINPHAGALPDPGPIAAGPYTARPRDR